MVLWFWSTRQSRRRILTWWFKSIGVKAKNWLEPIFGSFPYWQGLQVHSVQAAMLLWTGSCSLQTIVSRLIVKNAWNAWRLIKSSCKRNRLFSLMFRKINVSKQSISVPVKPVKMVSNCFITNVRHFFLFSVENMVVISWYTL